MDAHDGYEQLVFISFGISLLVRVEPGYSCLTNPKFYTVCDNI